jgi:hypothetical protein
MVQTPSRVVVALSVSVATNRTRVVATAAFGPRGTRPSKLHVALNSRRVPQTGRREGSNVSMRSTAVSETWRTSGPGRHAASIRSGFNDSIDANSESIAIVTPARIESALGADDAVDLQPAARSTTPTVPAQRVIDLLIRRAFTGITAPGAGQGDARRRSRHRCPPC